MTKESRAGNATSLWLDGDRLVKLDKMRKRLGVSSRSEVMRLLIDRGIEEPDERMEQIRSQVAVLVGIVK